tara:strand:- start:1994 stop:2698 length:705 start_codon:yes stop_codon:yes gene_type:complete
MDTKMPIIISFDGNIGSGKSSVVKYFEKNFEKFCNLKTYNYKICFLQEPVSTWESIIDKDDNKNIIEKFYADNKKYGFAFQMMAYISRLSLFKKALEKNYDIIITERSIFTDKNVFAKMLYDTKMIDNIEFQIYNKWFDEFSDIIKKIKTVYIRTTPEISEKRINNRSRAGENISLDYIKNCHYYHEIWLNTPDNIEKGNTLIINGNEETNTSLFINNNYYDNVMEKVFNFMNN